MSYCTLLSLWYLEEASADAVLDGGCGGWRRWRLLEPAKHLRSQRGADRWSTRTVLALLSSCPHPFSLLAISLLELGRGEPARRETLLIARPACPRKKTPSHGF